MHFGEYRNKKIPKDFGYMFKWGIISRVYPTENVMFSDLSKIGVKHFITWYFSLQKSFQLNDNYKR